MFIKIGGIAINISQKKDELARAARHLYRKGFVNGRQGNISFKLPECEELIIKATRSSFCGIKSHKFSRIDFNGKLITGFEQSGEWKMHVGIYKIKDTAKRNFIVHTHPKELKELFQSETKESLEKLLVTLDEVTTEGLSKAGFGIVPRIKPYSAELAEKVSEIAGKASIIVLWNHGLVTVCENLDDAVYFTEEFCDLCKLIPSLKN